VSTDAGGGAARAGRWRLLWIPLVLLAFGFGVWTLVGDRAAAVAALRHMSATELVAGAVLAVAFAGLNFRVWSGFARQLGATADGRVLARIFFVGQLGKYLPGPGWPVLLQGGLGRTAAQPPASTFGAALICAAFAPAVGVPVGLLLVFAGAPGRTDRLAWLLLPVLPLLVLLHPAVFGRLLAGAARLLRRPVLTVRLSGRAFAAGAGWQGAAWLALGAQTGLLASALHGRDPVRTAVLGAGAAVLAYCAGLFAIVLPAGLGVREGMLVLVLAPVVGTGRAAAVALVSRLLLVSADLLLAGVVLAGRPARRSARVHARRHSGSVEPAPLAPVGRVEQPGAGGIYPG
jgi:glycosyltransferase 2 family protein